MDLQEKKNNWILWPSLIIAILIYYLLLKMADFSLWARLPAIGLVSLFLASLINFSSGDKLRWGYLNKRDKFFYFLGITIYVFLPCFSIKQEWPFLVTLLSIILGYLAFWLIIYFWGSEQAKEKLLWPKPKQRQSQQ